MDWRHNQLVGVGAAILVVAGIVGIFYWLSRPSITREHGGYTFQCESSGDTFKITDAEMEKEGVYMAYFGKTEQPVKCRLDGNNDAYWSYYCPQCKKYYKWTRAQVNVDLVLCPDEHVIPENVD